MRPTSLPITVPLELYRGDTARWIVRCWDDAAHTMPTDLTGATARAQLRDAPDGALITSPVCTLDANAITLVLAPDITATMPAYGWWDVELVQASGDVYTLVRGTVTVTPDITTAAAAVRQEQLV